MGDLSRPPPGGNRQGPRPAARASGLRIRLLGVVEVEVDGVGAVPVQGAKLQALLAMLALASPHPVAAYHLIDELWGDEQPGHPENALQSKISHARRLL